MKYLALLRGINVGGNTIIKMSDLKKAVEAGGFTDVRTYIQSGNVIFESNESNLKDINTRLEVLLSKHLNFSDGVIVKTREQFKQIISGAPIDWNKRKDLRCYLAFIKEPSTTQDVMNEIQLKEGIDFLKAGDGVLYMSTLLSGLTKSGFTKLITKKVYKDITIRSFNTVLKLLELIQEDQK